MRNLYLVLLETEYSQGLLRIFCIFLMLFPNEVSQTASGPQLYNISHLIKKNPKLPNIEINKPNFENYNTGYL